MLVGIGFWIQFSIVSGEALFGPSICGRCSSMDCKGCLGDPSSLCWLIMFVDSGLVAEAVPGSWGSIAVRCGINLFAEVVLGAQWGGLWSIGFGVLTSCPCICLLILCVVLSSQSFVLGLR